MHLGPVESVHCDDSWVVVGCPELTLSYTGLVPFKDLSLTAGHHCSGRDSPSEQ